MSHERTSKFKFNSDLALEFLEMVKEDIDHNISPIGDAGQSAEDWMNSFQAYKIGTDDFREGFIEAIAGITGYDLIQLLDRLE